jgi:hypothetical protein
LETIGFESIEEAMERLGISDLRSRESVSSRVNVFNATSNSPKSIGLPNMGRETVLLPYLKKLLASIYIPMATETFITQIMPLL